MFADFFWTYISNVLAGLITLVGGSVPNEGDVHVDGVPVYQSRWDLQGAWVLCKQLGWQGVEAVKTNSYFGTRSKYYRYEYIDCSGIEESILDCQKSEYYDRDSIGSWAAGVICKPDAEDRNITLQSVDNNTNSGLVFLNGRPVCEDDWDMMDAKVACKQMGFNYVKHIIGNSFGMSVDLPYSMLDVQCVGEEDFLPDCIHIHANESSYCREGNAAGVECSNITKGIFFITNNEIFIT